ncbi:MAG TPA: ABC transporter permease [Vicinamibacterales bacterium]|jgi:ribose transport system permease protein|nr:ABC transporter permease [Vicinamibacterales bacterium]
MTRQEIGILLLLLVLCTIVAVASPQFLSVVNLQNVGRLVGTYGIFSIGVGIVIITGGIDLSVGSVCALLGVLLSMMLVEWRWPPAAALAAVVALGGCLGAVHGVLITRLRLQPFIVTLCGLLLYRGAARYIANDSTKGFGTGEGFEWVRALASGSVGGVPMPFVVMVVVAVMAWVLLHRSVFGRHLFAVGHNAEAARYSGVGTQTVVAWAYVLSGLLTALSAVIIAFYTNSISPASHGNFYELYAIAAAVVGGCSLRGGEGSVLGIVIGAALLQVLRNLVNLLDIPGSLDFAVMGAVILIGAVADQLFGRRMRRGGA